MAYAIETGIPAPLPRATRPRVSRQSYRFAEMRAGDSFLIPAEDGGLEANRRICVLTAARKAGVRVITRVSEDGLRVWRLT